MSKELRESRQQRPVVFCLAGDDDATATIANACANANMMLMLMLILMQTLYSSDSHSRIHSFSLLLSHKLSHILEPIPPGTFSRTLPHIPSLTPRPSSPRLHYCTLLFGR